MVANQLENLVQRWRTTEDFVPEDHELFLNAGHTCIAQGDYTQLLDFIKEEANQHIVRSMGSGLLPALVNEVLRKDRNPANCQAILNQLVQICSVKELLDILLQQVEEDTDPNAIADTITVLMPLIQSVFQLKNTIITHFLFLPVPYSHKQEQEDVYRLCRCCTAVLTFVQPFVQEVKNQDTYSVATKLRAALLKLYSLREPLQLDREVNMTEISPLWNFATEIMAILAVIQQSLPKILFYRPLRGKEDTISEKDAFHLNESRACMAYLLFVQLITIQVFPAVFSPVFVLQCNMEYINLLLSRCNFNNWCILGEIKCLLFLTTVLIYKRTVVICSQNLITFMTDYPIQHLVRGKSLVVYQLFIEKLNGEAKHTFFRYGTSHHAGVESIIIKNIKNQMERSYEDSWFEGTPLISLLRETLILPKGHETDLLHGMDRVMESLNLLRYLLIQERKFSNVIWTDLCHIADSYTKLLRLCLSMSKSYYGTELKRHREDKKIKTKGNTCFVLQCALVTYDLLESLVVHIEEINEDSQK
uniref:Glomulin, FKBP associated protein b n=2 Tax=Cyprinus carpio TaxID=7962 RepID=A0A8C1CEC9_CYPCA